MFNFADPKVAQISVESVKKALEKKEKVILLDVRNTSEFARERIQSSINLPVQEIISEVESLIPDKKQKIYVYCLSGARSTIAVEEMMKMGYTNVFSVVSGLLAWRANQYPTIS